MIAHRPGRSLGKARDGESPPARATGRPLIRALALAVVLAPVFPCAAQDSPESPPSHGASNAAGGTGGTSGTAGRPGYASFEASMTSYKASLEEQAFGFMVGGALGTGLSLHLASRDKETLPRATAAVVAGTAVLATLHGVSLAYRGDTITTVADELARTKAVLSRTPLSEALRARVMDRLLLERLVAIKRRRDSVRLASAAVGIASAAGGAAAMAYSRSRSTAGQVGLALFTLTSGVYGLASLVPSDGAAGLSGLQASADGNDEASDAEGADSARRAVAALSAPPRVTLVFQGASLGISLRMP